MAARPSSAAGLRPSAISRAEQFEWSQVAGVGLAIPGPYERYGVLGKSPNLPASFVGWDVRADYSAALAKAAGRPLPLTWATTAIAAAWPRRGSRAQHKKISVLMLMPGSGLGSAFVGRTACRSPARRSPPWKPRTWPRRCTCSASAANPFRAAAASDWGCVEAYTTISGLPHLLAEKLKKYPDHELAKSTAPEKEKVLSLRSRAQKGDALALEIFDFQARVMGLHVANLVALLDPGIVVIGGGLMDHEVTTPEFRERYLRIIRETAAPYLWPQRATIKIVSRRSGRIVAGHRRGARGLPH
jgi:glucokinase